MYWEGDRSAPPGEDNSRRGGLLCRSLCLPHLACLDGQAQYKALSLGIIRAAMI